MKSKEMQAEITIFSSDTDNIRKKFKLTKKGKIKKIPADNLVSGKAVRKKASLSDLQSIISGLKSNQCLCLGTCARKKQEITTQYQIDNGTASNKAIARTKRNFLFRIAEPAFCLLDIDGVDKSPDQILKILNKIIPGFKKAGKLIVPSSSAGIRNKKTKVLYSKKQSFHIYIQVQNGHDIPRFINAVFNILVLAGHGRIEISAAPSMLKRSLIDRAVASPERVIYEALPKCAKGLVQDSRKLHFISGGMLDTSLTKRPDERLVKLIWRELKKDNQKHLDVAINSKREKLLKKDLFMEPSQADEIIRLNQNGLIHPTIMLHFSDGKNKSADHVIKNGSLFDGKTLADPLEPDYDDGSLTKAKFYWNNGQDPIIHSFAHGGIDYRIVDNSGRILSAVQDLNNAGYSLCKQKGKTYILKDGKDPLTGLHTLDFSTFNDFALFEADKIIWLLDKKNKPKPHEATTLWKRHSQKIKYTSIVFDPSETVGPDSYNLFRGFNAVIDKKGSWKPFKEFMMEVVCDGDKEKFKWIMKWFQNIIREPWNKNNTAFSMYGDQGCGKGTFVYPFSQIFKEYYLHLQNASDVNDKFNAQYSGKLLIFADEAIFGKSKKEYNLFKAKITENMLNFEEKFQPKWQEKNYMNLITATNDYQAVYADLFDRRWTVYRLNNKWRGKKDKFRKLYQFMDEGGTAALCYHLLTTHKYDDVDSRVPLPTEELIEQQNGALNQVQVFWKDVLFRGYILSTSLIEEWPEDKPIVKSRIYEEFIKFCIKMNYQYKEDNLSFWRATDRKNNPNRIFKCCKKGHGTGNVSVFIPKSLKRMREDFIKNVVYVDFG